MVTISLKFMIKDIISQPSNFRFNFKFIVILNKKYLIKI